MATPTHPFVHLHLHSEYSLLDGGNRMDRLVKRVKELGMNAVAVTDHGNLYGAMEFYNAAKGEGIKPIMGIEAYVAPKDRTFRETTGVADGGFHLVLLAENMAGWKNLLKLTSDSFITGFYYKPRMDKSTLEQWGDGLIAINGHLGSSLAYILRRYVQNRDPKIWQEAVDEALWHKSVFKPNEKGEPRFYLELQRHQIKEQDEINPLIVRLGTELNLPLVCDNDSHFLLSDDWDAHDTLCCISTSKLKEDANRLHYPKDLYVKSPGQMAELFDDLIEAVENTGKIAERCNVDLKSKANHAPVVKIVKGDPDPSLPGSLDKSPVGSTPWFQAFCSQYKLLPFDQVKDKDISPAQLKARSDEALIELANAGALWRYGETGVTEEHKARLQRELKILADKSISAYFLIVWDFVNEARRRGIPANARGSGVGTMVGYCLGLSNACPVKYGLLFERFTDPDRTEYPDIDIDICQDGRQEIINYVRDKYGHVAQIITFGTLKAKLAVKDVSRVFNHPLGEVDKLTKLIGDGLDTTIEKALEQTPDLKKIYEDNPIVRRILDTANRLEGLSRHVGVHAAGVVIATQKLDNIIPLTVAKQTGGEPQIVTQWDGPTVEKAGLLKMDFLGLRTLSIIERAKQLIRSTLSADTIRNSVAAFQKKEPAAVANASDPSAPDPRPQTPDPTPSPDPLDLDRLTFNDPKVLELFTRGETAGVFQFESDGMRNLLMSMKPDRLEDLIAANALFRPGPMDLIPDYNDRKHGRQGVPKLHPIVDKYTLETYGVMVYQEQVMQIVHGLGGIPLRAAYTLIKDISKKKKDAIDAVRPTFVAGAEKQGLPKEKGAELFELILKFAGYGFNKSHSTGYAIVAYQTAYLKTYFPIQYMAAVLTYESVDIKKVVEYIRECRYVVLPGAPDKSGPAKRGIAVRPPDINLSDDRFTVVFDRGETKDANHGHIRFGLTAVKGVGEKAIKAVLEARRKDGRFKSLHDFCERVGSGSINRATIEALIKCGAFDSLHGIEKRAALLEALDGAIQAGQRIAADREAGQMNFFDAIAAAAPAGKSKNGKEEPAKSNGPTLPNVTPWSNREMLEHEKSVLGFYASSHPLDEHLPTIKRFGTATVEEAKALTPGVEVVIGGMLKSVRHTVIKTGRSVGAKMGIIKLEDSAGEIEGVLFSEAYALSSHLLEENKVVFIKGKIDRRREDPQVMVDTIIPVEQAVQLLTQAIRVVLYDPSLPNPLGRTKPYNGELKTLQQLFNQRAPGRGSTAPGAGVIFEIHQQGQVARLKLEGVRVAATPDLPDHVSTILGTPGCCDLIGAPRANQSPMQAMPYQAPKREAFKPTQLAQGEENCPSIDRY